MTPELVEELTQGRSRIQQVRPHRAEVWVNVVLVGSSAPATFDPRFIKKKRKKSRRQKPTGHICI